jgi:hypothetical protein
VNLEIDVQRVGLNLCKSSLAAADPDQWTFVFSIRGHTLFNANDSSPGARCRGFLVRRWCGIDDHVATWCADRSAHG